jgi:hypothetical protein
MTRAVERVQLVWQKSGKVINMASHFGLTGISHLAAYSAWSRRCGSPLLLSGRPCGCGEAIVNGEVAAF